tara:strand:- start:5034 stop:6590 length:1557 start_codon:yes stop_codon:yes gene_type:complete
MSFASKIGKVLQGAVQTLPGGIQLGTQIAETRRKSERQQQQDARQRQQDERQRARDAKSDADKRKRDIRAIAARGNYDEALRQAAGDPDLTAEITAQQQGAISKTVAGLPPNLSGALPTTPTEIRNRIGLLRDQSGQYGRAIADISTMGASESQLEKLNARQAEIQSAQQQFENLLNPFTRYASETTLAGRQLRRESLVQGLRDAGYNEEQIKFRVEQLDKAADQIRIDEIMTLLAIDPSTDFTGQEIPSLIQGAIEARTTQEVAGRNADLITQAIGFATSGAFDPEEAAALFDQIGAQYGLSPESTVYQSARNAVMQTVAQKVAATRDEIFTTLLKMQEQDTKTQTLFPDSPSQLRAYAAYHGVDLPEKIAQSDLIGLANTVALKQNAAAPRDITSDIKATPVDIDAQFESSMKKAERILRGNNNRAKEQMRAYLEAVISDSRNTEEQKARARQALGIDQESTPLLNQAATQTVPRANIPNASAMAESTGNNQSINFLPDPSRGTGQFGPAPVTRTQ